MPEGMVVLDHTAKTEGQLWSPVWFGKQISGQVFE